MRNFYGGRGNYLHRRQWRKSISLFLTITQLKVVTTYKLSERRVNRNSVDSPFKGIIRLNFKHPWNLYLINNVGDIVVFLAYRFKWNVVNREDMEGGEVIHDIREQVPPPVLQGHTLQVVFEGVDRKHVELCLPPGELVQGEVSSVLVNSVRVWSVLMLVDLNKYIFQNRFNILTKIKKRYIFFY